MALVFIPPPLRTLTEGRETVPVSGGTVGEVIRNLDAVYPGVERRLCREGRLQSGLNVVVGEHVAALGLLEPVPENAEVHFLPAVGGG